MASIDTRISKLEKIIAPKEAVCRQSQVVVYNPVTGEPLNTPDPDAARQIWIADDGNGLELANVR